MTTVEADTSAGRRWAARSLASLEALAGTRRGAVALFLAALGVYALQSLAVPLHPGRDLATYLRYYEQFVHGEVVLPMSMLYRTPVAPLVVGAPLDVAGAAVTQALFGVLYGASIVAWSATALVFGRRAALLTGVVLLVYPGYGILFHRLSVDAVFAAAFAAWALLLSRTIVRPSATRFVLLGLGVAVLALTRPGNQVLLVFALAPLLVDASWRRRVAWSAAFLAPAVAALGLWTVHNGVRYGDYAVARGSGAFIPFFRVFTSERIVSPENGSASRELGREVARRLLPEEPYRSYGVDMREFFSSGDMGMWEDLVNVSDQAWGWDSDYSKLRAVALEAVREHPGAYAKGVANTIFQELWQPVFTVWGVRRAPDTTDAVVIGAAGRRLPRPTNGGVIPAAHQDLYTTTPDGHIREVWTSATTHHSVFDDPRDQERLAAMTANVGELHGKIPAYDGNRTLALNLNRASRWFPRPLLWIVVGVAAIAIRRPRRWPIAFALASAGMIIVVFTALGIQTVVEYATPVVPAFIVLASAGLVGRPDERVGH